MSPDGGPAHQTDEPISIPVQAWSRDVAAGGGYIDGAPIGGLGAGSVTWRFDGSFYLDRLKNGGGITSGTGGNVFTQHPDPNFGFFLYQKAGGASATVHRLDSSLGSGQATYYSLFPRAWVDYSGPAFSCKARVEQYSPIIPGDYQRTSYPVGIYRWQIKNPTTEPCEVAVMLTWKNNQGGQSAAATTMGSDVFLTLQRGAGSATNDEQGEFTLASRGSDGVTISYQSAQDLGTLQASFASSGALGNTTGADPMGAIAFHATVQPGGTTQVPIVVAWDIPLADTSTNHWYREYTKYFANTGLNSAAVAAEAIAHYEPWLWSIEDWQSAVLRSTRYPDWLKGDLFNELYYYFVAGTFWTHGTLGTDPHPGRDMFSSLESTAYLLYGTSDVRFYSSWALLQLWPDIDKQEVEQFCDSVAALGTTAHDYGGPTDVFTHWNAYTNPDTTKWKDLNSKLVLMVYRDWALTGKTDQAFLDYCWPSVKTAMNKVHGEISAAGLPASSGIDQTYDQLGLSGDTSYCGSLYLAACEAASAMATVEGDAADAATYQAWLAKGQGSFETELWTGSYYKIDTGSTNPARIMADQLAGEWYARAVGLPPIVPADHARSAFQTIYANNYEKFAGGQRGVANVMTATGQIDTSSSQAKECWVGTSWGVVSGMIQEGLASSAAPIGQSLVNTIWNTDQLWFRTPEAWYATQAEGLRAPYYMRAPTVWAAKRAYDISP
jgi:non-lysosomal glucosylceramidase